MKHLFVWVLEGPVFAITASQPAAGLVVLGIFANRDDILEQSFLQIFADILGVLLGSIYPIS